MKFYEHPEYIENKNFWELYEDLYQGEHAQLTKSGVLWMHELEAADLPESRMIRARREQRTRYINRYEPIVSRYVSMVFRNDPVMDEKVLALFGDNKDLPVTDEGKSFIAFLKSEIAPDYFNFGNAIAVTDSWNIPVRNLEEQQKLGIRPMFESLCPLEVKDWEYDALTGGFKWARYEYDLIEPRGSAGEEPKKVKYSKVYSFDNGTCTITTYKQTKEAEQGATEWVQVAEVVKTGVPAMPVRIVGDDESWLKDVAQVVLKLHNLESSRDNIHYYQSYQRLFFVGVETSEHKKALSEYTAGFIPAGGNVISIEPVQTTALDNNIAETKLELVKVAFNQGRASTDSGVVESATTQAATKEQLKSLLLSQISDLENFANNLLKDYAFQAKKISNFDGKITFSRDLVDEVIDEQIRIYAALQDEINKSTEWRKQTLAKFVQYQNLPDQKAVLEDIAKTPATQGNAEPLRINGLLRQVTNGNTPTTS